MKISYIFLLLYYISEFIIKKSITFATIKAKFINMKSIRNFLILCVVASTVSSCLSDGEDSYYAGFVVEKPTSSYCATYANNTIDSLVFVSYGDWKLEHEDTSTWCTIATTSGSGYVVSRQQIKMEQNTSGLSRATIYKLVDVNHSDKASSQIMVSQFATRGDGSLGNAPLVKGVTGSDGSSITATYDTYERPLSLNMSTSDGTFSRELTFSYDDYDSLITVNVKKRVDTYKDTTYTLTNQVLKGKEAIIGEPNSLYTITPGALVKSVDGTAVSNKTVSDSVYYSAFYSNYMAISFSYAFKLIHTSGAVNYAQAIYLNDQNCSADNEHKADSVGITRLYPDATSFTDIYKATYSTNSNRTSSFDVNQLVEGIKDCDPYFLLSMFRYARNSYIMSEALGKKTTKTISVELNTDKSVKSMTVVDSKTGSVTYQFTY
jgi:hypothetical protein